ncbi:acetyl-CoA decarbonylase/synthase complex subunit delta [Treponema endosymbiont of Eucomonympha sp.]|uniref:acetyl-CoA decarbonylase/synthase complex subunit delta n=1 Tax=Treponema endosymbiont of Eucomonympha sp. TaxID=1580831 RepID=UPI00078572E3|nr:acetyl-CoA decarbonylase/synthase complex subunit delta [Treponema endosymbiont of Eucomonympha sp.]
MPFKRVPQKFTSAIKEVALGTGDTLITLGGENVYPLYGFDEPLKNPPKVGVEVSDLGPNRDLPGIAAFYAGATKVADAAKKACQMPGADFVSLVLESADPNGQDKPIEDCVALCKEVAAAITLPLVIQGCKNVEKDGKLFVKIAEALQGKNVLLMSAKEDNHKAIAVAAVQAYGQKIGAESSVDINLAKQLNVLISQLGISGNNVAMNVGSSAAGYGFEYVASTMDRIKGAALSQNDAMLQMPIITPVAGDAWSVKESVVSEEDFPEWGPVEQRGIDMEIVTAASALAAGSNAVILRHPVSVATVSKLVKELV